MRPRFARPTTYLQRCSTQKTPSKAAVKQVKQQSKAASIPTTSAAHKTLSEAAVQQVKQQVKQAACNALRRTNKTSAAHQTLSKAAVNEVKQVKQVKQSETSAGDVK